MSNQPRLLATVCLIVAAATGIVTATTKVTETAGAVADDLTSPLLPAEDQSESSAFPTNNTGAKAFFSRPPTLRDPPPIENTRFPPGVPCGTRRVTCDCPDSPYRTPDGTCNNLLFPARGSVGFPLSRLQRGRYANSKGKMITRGLPLVRVISTTLYTDRDVPSPRVTTNIVTWGQATAHDSGLIIPRRGPGGRPLQCCTNDAQMLRRSHPNCCAIEIPPMDPFYSQFSRRCMDMVRSEILDSSACSENDILQIILASHYQDMSFTYGNSKKEMDSLRTFSGGQLKAKILPGWKGSEPRMFMPNDERPMQNCFVRSENEPCYKSGDARVNENLGLAGLQTLMLREHNRVARILQDMHQDWDDETLFQETRRIVIGEWQYITYNDFLPKIIGEVLMSKLNLHSQEEGFSDGYIPEVDASTMNEFTTGAFRFPHSLIQGAFELTSEKRCPFKSYWLRDFYMRPGKIEKGDNLDALLRGTSTQACQAPDRHFVKDITLFLMKNRLPFGDDLEATDIQRGRDHGLPSYNDMRFYCGLPRATIFEEFLDVMSEKNVLRLKRLYRHVDHVDFFVGGSLEVPGVMGDFNALVGHTFGCVIGEQFWRWKFGDRYFFDFSGQAGSFTLQQLNGIKKTSLSALMCENLSIKFIQKDAFLRVFEGNELKNCNDIEKLDLSGWINFTPANACGSVPV